MNFSFPQDIAKSMIFWNLPGTNSHNDLFFRIEINISGFILTQQSIISDPTEFIFII